MAQPELAARVSIPVAISALIQPDPFNTDNSTTDKIDRVITYDDSKLGSSHLSRLQVKDIERVHIIGAPQDGGLKSMIRGGAEYNHAAIEEELVQCAITLLERYPDIDAIVLEYTQMPPFAEVIQQAVNLPVYDIYSMVMCFYPGLVRQAPRAWSIS